ncbi:MULTISPECIES: hypothetical protein [Parachlamydia]|uniref:hypothetical protein n=1 Tax=Parachlamydia TaxID=83551 RepID=UPI0001C17BAE|nr:hypothetical protein [Parachlamydia acanthamoebae]EFB42052.1 hypothetical protein pah_c016o108 [Parachlamydia acanthamoebae str. Hall's coccus]
MPISSINHLNRGEHRKAWDPKPSHERPGRQEAHHCISIRDRIRSIILEMRGKTWGTREFLSVSNELFTLLTNPLLLAGLYEEDIQHHVEARVATIWGQFNVAYDEGGEFAVNEKIRQFFVSPSLKIVSEDGDAAEVKYQAAHSSTLPVLKVRRREDGAPYFEVLKGSHLDNLNNSTMGLPDFVNQVDTLIDGTNTKGLRSDAIALVNAVAQRIISPVEAMQNYLDCFAGQLVSRPKVSRSMTPEKAKVVRIYQEKVQQMRALANVPFDIQAKHPFFDDLLSVNLQKDHPQDIPFIRSILFELKPEIIHEAWIVESNIQEKIEEISHGHEDANFVRHCLIYLANEKDEFLKRSLEKLFCVSLSAMADSEAWINAIENELEANEELYENILGKIQKEIEYFKLEEEQYRLRLIDRLRGELCRMSLDQLMDEVGLAIERRIEQEKSCWQPNDEVIRSLERLFVYFSMKDPLALEVIADALEVSSDHFKNSFFASDE